MQEGVHTLDVTPHQQDTHILWNTFDVGSQAAVDFHHSSANYVTVNEVVGSKLSEVAGRISVDQGQVYILNPQGIVYHDGATIDGSIIMGTNTLNRSAFYDNGHVLLNAPDLSGPVLINGNLTIKEAGLLGIVAPYFANKGHVTGELHVAAGKKVRVDFGDKRLTFTIDGKLKEAFLHTTKESSIEGRAVTMTVGTLERVLDETIRLDGDIRVGKDLKEEDGRLFIKGGDTGKVIVSGTLDASGAQDSEGNLTSPGKVLSVTGHTVIAEPSARLRADGTTGGKILFGVEDGFDRSLTPSVLQNPRVKAEHVSILPGAEMSADATTGKGGAIIAISKGFTSFQEKLKSPKAAISATSQKGPGGFVEISGEALKATGRVNVRSLETSEHGHILFDPTSIYVAPLDNPSSTITGETIMNNLSGGNFTLQTNGSPDTLTIADNIMWEGSSSLNLISGTITILSGGSLIGTGSGNLNLRTAYNTSLTSNNSVVINAGGTIDLSQGTGTIRTFSSNGESILNNSGGTLSGPVVNYMNIYGPTTSGPHNGIDYVMNNLSGNYGLTNNITMGSWVPPASTTVFSGKLTGDSLGAQGSPYAITINATTSYTTSSGTGNIFWGFFPQLLNATIDSLVLTFQNAGPPGIQLSLDASNRGSVYAGFLAGLATNSQIGNVSINAINSIANALVRGSLFVYRTSLAQNIYTGGLVGNLTGGSTASNITINSSVYLGNTIANMTGNLYLGGITGGITSSSISSSQIADYNGLSVTSYEGASFNGGSVFLGGASGIAGANAIISNFSFSKKSSLNTNFRTSGLLGGNLSNVFMGGILGGSSSNGVQISGNNFGEFLFYTGGGPITIENLALGGIVGSLTGGGTVGTASNYSVIDMNSAATMLQAATVTNFYQGGVIGYSSGPLTNVTNEGSLALAIRPSSSIQNLYQGGIVGYQAAGSLTNSHNTAPLSMANVATLGNLYQGGVIGYNASSGPINGNSNTSNVTFQNAPAASATVSGNVAVGGFVGNSTTSINGTSGSPNTNSGAVTVTNGNGSNVGTLGTTVNIGGFAGSVTGNLRYAQVLTGGNLLVTSSNSVFNSDTNVAGLVASTTGSIINSSASGNVSYTENSAIPYDLFIAGLVAQTTGSAINDSSYGGNLSVTANSAASMQGNLSLAGIVAFPNSSLIISGSSLGANSSVILTNSGIITALLIGGISAANGAPLTISGSSVGTNASLGITNTLSGQIDTYVAVGGLVADCSYPLTLSGSSNQGNLFFNNSGTLDASFYYGGIIASPRQGSTINQTFNTGGLSLTNSGTLGGNLYIGGFAGQGNVAGNFTAVDVYTTGPLSVSNSSALSANVYVGGFIGSALSASTISTSYSRSSVSLTNTGTITGITNMGNFAGNNAGTISDSYVLQSALPVVGNGSSSGITSLQPIQIVQSQYFPAFNFNTIWAIQNFLTSPYFMNSAYIPGFPGFELEATYLQQISKVAQDTLTALHDHRTLISLEDPLKSVSVESRPQNDGFDLFGHEDVFPAASESSFKIEEEEGIVLS